MKHFLLLALLLSGCQTERINRQLRLSNKHLNRALELGAHLDSTKTIIHDTISIDKIHDRIVRVTKYDTLKLQALCPEAKTPVQKKAIQKLVCPDVVKDTVYHHKIIVQGKTYDNPVHIIASSVAGVASLQIDAKPLTIQYTKEEIQANATPGNEPTVFGKILRSAGLLLIGMVIGFILSKIFKFGVNL